jgi:hypothetical protein
MQPSGLVVPCLWLGMAPPAWDVVVQRGSSGQLGGGEREAGGWDSTKKEV